MKARIFTVIAICVLILTACGAGSGASQANEAPKNGKSSPMLHIAMVKGKVEVREKAGGQFVPAQVGQKLGVGAEIRTGADSVVALYRDKLSMVVLDQKSAMVVKKLAFKAGQPITILALINGAAAVEHNGKLPEGAVLAIETPNKQLSGVVGSTVRVSFDTEKKVMTATCISGECNFVKGGQTLGLKEGQQVDVTGMVPLPGMPNQMEISVEQANGFLAQAHLQCGCDLPISEIKETGLSSITPPPDEVPSPEEDLAQSADEDGNTDPATDEVSEEMIDEMVEESTDEIMEEITGDSTESPEGDATEAPATEAPVTDEATEVPATEAPVEGEATEAPSDGG